MMKNAAFLFLLLAACKDSTAKQAPGPSLGACVGTVKAGVPVPEGNPNTYCLEDESESECTAPSTKFDWVYRAGATCSSQGYALRCAGTNFPARTRFKACPVSPELAAGREAVALFKAAIAAGDATKNDCTAWGKELAPLRDKLWDLGKAHPSVFKQLSDPELKEIGAADAMEALTARLPTCKDNVHAKEFAYAIGKLF